MQGGLTIWHNRRDTLLRLVDGRRNDAPSDGARHASTAVESDAPYYSVYIPIGISPGTLRRHNITVEFSIDLPYGFEDEKEYAFRQQEEKRGRYMRVGLNRDNPLGHITRITPDYIAHLRHIDPGDPDPTRVRPYLEMDRVFKAQPANRRPAYYEAVLHAIPRGARLRYRIKVYSKSRMPDAEPVQPVQDEAGSDPADGAWYSIYALAPIFTFEDIKHCPSRESVPDVNVVYWKIDGQSGLLALRFDFYDVQRAINDFEIAFRRQDGTTRAEGRLAFAWFFDAPHPGEQVKKNPVPSVWTTLPFPIVSQQFDYVTLVLPLEGLSEGEEVIWRGKSIGTFVQGDLCKIDQAQDMPIEPVRLMFVHYANQSLNDLFESPNKNYTPPRTYLQTTMRDELGTYSSRPTSNETGVGDGYAYVVETHVQNKLPGLFSLNGGFLSMLAQDAPDQLAMMNCHIDSGLFEPVIGGFAGHRMLYFLEETNRRAIQYGIDLIEHLMRGTSRVFHPNSRLYAATSNIDAPIIDAVIRRPLRRAREDDGALAQLVPDGSQSSGIQFVVIDESAYRNLGVMPHLEPARKLWGGHEHCYIWRQRCIEHRESQEPCTTGCKTWYWLFIDEKMKDELFGASEDEWRAGKLFSNLRQHFFYGVSQPDIARHALLVYGDDQDKAAGNGWFDGDYNGAEGNNAAVFAAALEWIAAHPWLQVVTAADLVPEEECAGTVYVQDAIDPYIHQDREKGEAVTPGVPPPWAKDGPAPGQLDFDFVAWATTQMGRLPDGLGFEYARWFRRWYATQATWLDRRFGPMAAQLERVIMDPARAQTANTFDTLAQLAFLLAIHEPHWSKKPLEPFVSRADFDAGELHARRAYRRPEMLEPEDFVLAQTLQMRNAHVYLCAARWADLVDAASGKRGKLDDTPLRNSGPLIDEIGAQCRQLGDAFGQTCVNPALQWDLDITENVILYNQHLLVVMDSNGGRITHIFAVARDGAPVVVSGNIKAYQFLGDDRLHGGQLPCNGAVLQNTVLVPNHRYVASDVHQARPLAGKRHNPKTRLKTIRRDHGTARVEDGVFGEEDWLYPDNFNCYERRDHDDGTGAVTWTYPGLAWAVDPTSTDAFERALSDYRQWIVSKGTDRRYAHGYPKPDGGPFTKTIRLVGNRIEIQYDGMLESGHLVANEFSVDMFAMVMYGTRQRRTWYVGEYPVGQAGVSQIAEITRCDLTAHGGGVSVIVQLGDNCRFSHDTLEAEMNLRLHRAFSDCIEVESIAPGSFSYAIEVQ